MIPALIAAVAEAGPMILLPVTMAVGFMGYKLENYITKNRKDNQQKSIIVSDYIHVSCVFCSSDI